MELQAAFLVEGAKVEVTIDDPGFSGAWFEATVVPPGEKRKRVRVKYENLFDEKDQSKHLRETANISHVRPRPPRNGDENREFQVGDKVEVFFNDGWWIGDVAEVLENSVYVVKFPQSEPLEIGRSDLRPRRDWVGGKWVSFFDMGNSKVNFQKGTLVEVGTDEEGFLGAWFTATIIEPTGKNEFIVEYQSLRTDDESQLLRETVHSDHIRPFPPDTLNGKNFRLFEEVDAFYNDGWWVGLISKVLEGLRYTVYFRQTKEEMEFGHSDLRLHQDWIDGRWFRTSEAVKLFKVLKKEYNRRQSILY